MRFAYADPPYPGCAHYYAQDPNAPEGGAREVNHRILIGWLCDEFPDGWALSTHANALRDVLNLCPSDVRVGAWCKPFAAWKINPNHPVPYAWEPVIWRSSRKGMESRTKRRGVVCRDFTVESPPMKQRVPGEKPPRFSWWVFQLLGATPEDDLVDVFPGSGAVTEAWKSWVSDWQSGSGTLFPETAA